MQTAKARRPIWPVRFDRLLLRRPGSHSGLGCADREEADGCSRNEAVSVKNVSVYAGIASGVRIPTKPAMHSNLKPAARSDLKPAIVPI